MEWVCANHMEHIGNTKKKFNYKKIEQKKHQFPGSWLAINLVNLSRILLFLQSRTGLGLYPTLKV